MGSSRRTRATRDGSSTESDSTTVLEDKCEGRLLTVTTDRDPWTWSGWRHFVCRRALNRGIQRNQIVENTSKISCMSFPLPIRKRTNPLNNARASRMASTSLLIGNHPHNGPSSYFSASFALHRYFVPYLHLVSATLGKLRTTTMRLYDVSRSSSDDTPPSYHTTHLEPPIDTKHSTTAGLTMRAVQRHLGRQAQPPNPEQSVEEPRLRNQLSKECGRDTVSL